MVYSTDRLCLVTPSRKSDKGTSVSLTMGQKVGGIASLPPLHADGISVRDAADTHAESPLRRELRRGQRIVETRT